MKCPRCGDKFITKEAVIGQVMPDAEGNRRWKNHGTVFNHGSGSLCGVPVDGESYEIFVDPEIRTSEKVPG